MKLDEFQAIARAHGGYRDAPVALDPEAETTDKFGRPSKGPNPTPKYRYVFNDGTTLVAVTSYDGDVQIVDPGTALNKTGVEALSQAEDPTKPFALGGKLVRRTPEGKYAVVFDPAAPDAAGAEPPTVRTLPSGAQEEWNPTTKKWEVHAPAKRTAPAVDLGAPRPGQKRDLRAVELAYNAFAQQLAADPNITDEEYNRRLQAYIAANVTPAVEQAAREVEEEADRKRREQEAETARTVAREGRLDTAAERTEARSYAEFQQRAGQNAVSNALALLPYRANPKFLQQFSAGLNVLAGGGGVVTFTPDAFEVPLPDLDALATQGAERAAALYRAAGGVPVAPRTAGVVEPSPAAAALATTPMALPPGRPSMAGPGGAPPADFPVGVPSPALYDELRRGRVGPGFASGQGYAY